MAEPDPYRSALRGFAALVEPTQEDASIDLAAAALAIARTEYPGLDVRYYLGRLHALGGSRPGKDAQQSHGARGHCIAQPRAVR